MSAKARDEHGRWRSRTVSFRMSEQEINDLHLMVALSGLTKQDYIIRKLLNRDVVVNGNPRVFKALKDSMADVYSELRRIGSGQEPSAELLETIRTISVFLEKMTKEETK